MATPTFLGDPNVLQLLRSDVRDEVNVIIASIDQLLLVLRQTNQIQPHWNTRLQHIHHMKPLM